jgi:peptidoglycan hydrolase CwlO-like protein
MKKLMNTKLSFCALAVIFASSLSFSVNAEDMNLEDAKAEITRLEEENTSLKQELEIYEKKISEHREKLEEHDKMIAEMTSEQESQ